MNYMIILLFSIGFMFSVFEMFRFMYCIVVKRYNIKWNFRFIVQSVLILFSAQVPIIILNAIYPAFLMPFWLLLFPFGIGIAYLLVMRKIDKWGVALIVMPISIGLLLMVARKNSLTPPGEPGDGALGSLSHKPQSTHKSCNHSS